MNTTYWFYDQFSVFYYFSKNIFHSQEWHLSQVQWANWVLWLSSVVTLCTRPLNNPWLDFINAVVISSRICIYYLTKRQIFVQNLGENCSFLFPSALSLSCLADHLTEKIKWRHRKITVCAKLFRFSKVINILKVLRAIIQKAQRLNVLLKNKLKHVR